MAKSENIGEPQRRPRWPNRRSKSSSTWLQYGYSTTIEVVKIAPRWHIVNHWGIPEKAKVAQQKTEEDFQMAPRLLLKGKARWSRWCQDGIEEEHWGPHIGDQDGPT